MVKPIKLHIDRSLQLAVNPLTKGVVLVFWGRLATRLRVRLFMKLFRILKPFTLSEVVNDMKFNGFNMYPFQDFQSVSRLNRK